MDELQLWTNGEMTTVARSAREAVAMCAQACGYSSTEAFRADEGGEERWRLRGLAPTDKLTIHDEDLGPQTKTVAAWIRTNSPGYLSGPV